MVRSRKGKTKIQSYIFDRSCFTEDEAIKWLENHDRPIKKIDVKKKTIRFRQRNVSKDKQYRTICLTCGIKAVIEVPDKQLEGGFSLSIKMPPKVDNYLDAHGDKKIIKGSVCREPIWKVISTLGNLFTFGRFNQVKERLNYDNFYHVWINLELEGGVEVMTEKNQFLVMTNGNKPPGRGGSCMPVPLLDNSEITLREFFENAVKEFGENQIFEYDAVDQNCQNYAVSLLEASNVIYPRIKEWILQNVKDVIGTDILRKGLRFTTNVARAIGFLSGEA